MIYELRRYECMPGQLKNVNELMEVLAVPVFKKVGMTFLGAWKPEVGDDENTLVYLLGYPDMGSRERAWKAFYEDPEWVTKRAEFAKKYGGPVVARTSSVFLTPTRYSPMQ
jgi:NIPSNAP